LSWIDVKFQRHEFPFEALAWSERIKILLAQNTVNLHACWAWLMNTVLALTKPTW